MAALPKRVNTDPQTEEDIKAAFPQRLRVIDTIPFNQRLYRLIKKFDSIVGDGRSLLPYYRKGRITYSETCGVKIATWCPNVALQELVACRGYDSNNYCTAALRALVVARRIYNVDVFQEQYLVLADKMPSTRRTVLDSVSGFLVAMAELNEIEATELINGHCKGIKVPRSPIVTPEAVQFKEQMFTMEEHEINSNYCYTTDILDEMFKPDNPDAQQIAADIATSLYQSSGRVKTINASNLEILAALLDTSLADEYVSPDTGYSTLEEHVLPVFEDFFAMEAKGTSTGHVNINTSEIHGSVDGMKKSDLNLHISKEAVLRCDKIKAQRQLDKRIKPGAHLLPHDLREVFIKAEEYLKKGKKYRWIFLQCFLFMKYNQWLYKRKHEDHMGNLHSSYGYGWKAKDGGADRITEYMFGIGDPRVLKYISEFFPDYLPAYRSRDYKKLEDLFYFRTGDVKYFDFSVVLCLIFLYHLSRFSTYDNSYAEKPITEWTDAQFINFSLFCACAAGDAYNICDIDPVSHTCLSLPQVGSGQLNTSDMGHFIHLMLLELVEKKYDKKRAFDMRLLSKSVHYWMTEIRMKVIVYSDDKIEMVAKECKDILDELEHAREFNHVSNMRVLSEDHEGRFFSEVDMETGELKKKGAQYLKNYFVYVAPNEVRLFRPYDELVTKLYSFTDLYDLPQIVAGLAYLNYGSNKKFLDKCHQIMRYIWSFYDHGRPLSESARRKLERIKFKTNMDLSYLKPHQYIQPFEFYVDFYRRHKNTQQTDGKVAVKYYLFHAPRFLSPLEDR